MSKATCGDDYMDECLLDKKRREYRVSAPSSGMVLGWDGFGMRGASTPEEGALQRGGYFSRYAPIFGLWHLRH